MSARVPVVLVFGEDDNDRSVLAELVRAIRPDAPRIEKRRTPLILVKGREAASRKRNAQDVASQVKRDGVRFNVRGVIAHEDCDAVEPADESLATAIEDGLKAAGVPEPIGAAPAWEMEAWFFQWPDAAPFVCASWQRPARTGRRVGLIMNAKEEFRRALRPAGRRVRDYEESDGPKIAREVRERGMIGLLDAESRSYNRFASRVHKAEW